MATFCFKRACVSRTNQNKLYNYCGTAGQQMTDDIRFNTISTFFFPQQDKCRKTCLKERWRNVPTDPAVLHLVKNNKQY